VCKEENEKISPYHHQTKLRHNQREDFVKEGKNKIQDVGKMTAEEGKRIERRKVISTRLRKKLLPSKNEMEGWGGESFAQWKERF